jgi:hypothetical protein
MRRHVLQTWTAASLLLTGLLMAGASATDGFRVRGDDGPRMTPWPPRVEHCAASAPVRRHGETDGAASPRSAATTLLVLLAQRARLDRPSR